MATVVDPGAGLAGQASALVGAAALAIAAVTAAAQEMPLPRNTRHALIFGIGEYSAPNVPPLKGVVHDLASARRIAQAMAIPEANIRVVRDQDATGERIRAEIDALDARVRDGDRVFVYYSGHGTRWLDAAAGDGSARCTEGLYAADAQVLSNAEMGQRLAPISRRADKMLVFYDACFSGGVAGAPFRTRAPALGADRITPKFTPAGAPAECAEPSNFRTRSLALVMQQREALPGNVVHVAAARPDEVSFDSATLGGFATTAWRDCLLGEARDLDHSGGVTVEEVTRCAQDKVTAGLSKYPDILGQHMVVAGNGSFVPAWMSAAFAPAVGPSVPAAASSAPQPPAEPPRLTPAQMLEELHRQRDAARGVHVELRTPDPRVGADPIVFDITSPRDGWLYLALAGSDGKSLYLLYPNALAADNRIRAGQTLRLPGPTWEVAAGGPAGTETLLAIVTDAPRDLKRLPAETTGPFMKALLDERGRARLQELMANGTQGTECAAESRGAGCSDAFGSAMLSVRTRP